MSEIISKYPQKIKTANYESTEKTHYFEQIFKKLYGSNKSKSQFFESVYAVVDAQEKNSLQNLFAGGFFKPIFLTKPRFLGVLPQVLPLDIYENTPNWYQRYHLSEAKVDIPLEYQFADSDWRAPRPFPKGGNVVWGIDTEYVAKGGENEILSTQIWLYELGCGFIFFHKAGERTELSTLASLILAFLGVRIGEKKATKYCFWFVAHFNIAEYASLSIAGRNELLEWDNETKTYTKRGIGQLIRKSVATMKPKKLNIRTAHTAFSRGYVGVNFQLRDTYLINPVSLKKIGESIGLEKLDVGDNIEQMNVLLDTDIALYIDYAMRDPHITAKYFESYRDICLDFGIKNLPMTSSGLGVSYLRTKFDKQDFVKYTLGEEYKIYSRDGYLRPKIRYSANLESWKHIYHGGRNECFLRDFNKQEETFDYDLVNAYPTSILTLGTYDVEAPAKYYDEDHWLEQIRPDDLGLCKIEFECHDWVLYPPFSYEDPEGRGLVHYRKGILKVTSVELWSAIKNGFLKHIRLIWGVFYPNLGDNPIQDVIEELIRLRAALKSDNPLKAELFKLITNSIYGKFAQGLKKTHMAESAITCPAIAAQITGIIRAAVCEQMNYLTGQGHVLVSVTTDGYLSKSEITDKQINDIDKLPISSILANAREKHGLGRKILELKHQGKGWFGFKTRAYGQFEGDKLLFAKGGVKIDTNQTNFEKYQFLCEVAEKGGYDEVSIIPKNQVFQNRKDLVTITKEHKRMNLDLDFKRKHIYVQDIKTKELRIITEPYQDEAEYLKSKKIHNKIYNRSDGLFANRNMHSKPERFFEFFVAKAIYEEIPDDIKLDSIESFCIEALISKPENAREFKSDRQLARELNTTGKTVNKWRNNKRLSWENLSAGLRELVSLYVETKAGAVREFEALEKD